MKKYLHILLLGPVLLLTLLCGRGVPAAAQDNRDGDRYEMVVVEREENKGNDLDRKGAFRPSEVFYDMVQEYWDKDYWSEYNIIEPTESLENAVKRLKRKQ